MKAIILNTVLPPFSVLIAALVLAYWAAPRDRRGIVAFAAAVLVLLHVPALGRLLIVPLLSGVPSLSEEGVPLPEAVVVPTGGAVRLASGMMWPGDETVMRYDRGLELAAALNVPLVVVGGPAGGLPVAESRIVVDAIGRRVDVPLIVGELSLNTCANATEAASLLSPLNIETVAAVTSWGHRPRWIACLRHAGLRPVLPPPKPMEHWHENLVGSLLPGVQGANVLQEVARSYAGLLWYLWLGRIDFGDLGWGDWGP